MKVHPDCIPCIMRQALETSKIATNDEAKWEKALQQVAYLLSKTTFGKTPLTVSHKAQRVVRKVTGVHDPYENLKKESNGKAMEMYPELKQKVSDSEDRFYTALRLAVAGNVIDVGPGHDFEIKETVEDVLDQEFSINHFDFFEKEVKNADKIFYLGDNAGEIVFDRVFLEELEGDITFFARNGPILNDATVDDAESVGLDEIAEVKEIESEKEAPGLDDIPEEFSDILKEADIVISKGQGNYEAFSEVDANIFYVLMVKCPLIAREIGVEKGDIVLKGAQY